MTLAMAPVGVATSMTLSASSASLFKPVNSGVEAKTILTLGGRRWRNSSHRNDRTKVKQSKQSDKNLIYFKTLKFPRDSKKPST